MKKVAITGSYATGKSTILNSLRDLGCLVFDADVFVGTLYIDDIFQNMILQEIEGLEEFDKEKLAKIVYSSEKQRKKLESIIHPLVIKEVKRLAKENSSKEIIFCEIPLLFEVGLANEFDISVCVYCDEKTREERAKQKKNFSIERYKKLEEIQLSQEEKKRYADYVIDSGKDDLEITREVKQLVQKIKEDKK